MDLESAASFWVLGLLPNEDLPAVAADALEAGVDTPALRILAGERDPDVGELNRLFSKALEESSIELPNRSVAMANAAKYCAERILSRDWTPYRGASAIWSDLCTIEDAPENLKVFVGLASEHEDFEYRAKHDPEAGRILSEIERQIVAEARSVSGRSPKSSQ
jgi:hypothetical protein